MRRVLRQFKVFPAFQKHLMAFGEKSFARDEGFTGYDLWERLNKQQECEGIGKRRKGKERKGKERGKGKGTPGSLLSQNEHTSTQELSGNVLTILSWLLLETCFLWKYIQRDDSHGQYPWTIRHALVYQNFSWEAQTSTNILVRTPPQTAACLKHSFNATPESRNAAAKEWLGLQKIWISCGGEEWRQALNYYDERITILVSPQSSPHHSPTICII